MLRTKGALRNADCFPRIISPMNEEPLVGVVMGSKSDYEVLSAAVEILRALEHPA